jgi:hypothetical protein
VHGERPACATENTLSAIAIVAVRPPPVFLATWYVTAPLPRPVSPDRIVIQLTSLAAAHEQLAAVATVMSDPAPPSTPID